MNIQDLRDSVRPVVTYMLVFGFLFTCCLAAWNGKIVESEKILIAEVGSPMLLDDGKIRSDYTNTIGTGLTIDQAVHFETFNNLLVICTVNNFPQIWNGKRGD